MKKKNIYSIRKLGVGIASVTLGTLLISGGVTPAANAAQHSKEILAEAKKLNDAQAPKEEDNNKPGKEDGNGVHVVKPGDTVNDIAKANGTTADKIAADNKLADKNMIKPGQELVVDKKQPANHADANKAQALPETGEENPFIGTTVFGGLSLALGAALLAGRRREL
ncbi:TPA: LysM peptidoglycan-binding domain-containing protein [Staphylococcus aureus]|nr:LysM peptidoglycan-binding domain-containing protein [Staphylococcus aureus]HDD0399236.1 LysM peptidoglycan-binding domain-containing protein [Staphylococcus aureus]HDD0839253.1 LysM peptidoglycan-binding domain-containing protein [Staphylococcus aureus]HDD0840456.1 LysM peptidoglycan-binding domain-containing protein [Staphylococcus aureus]